MRNCARFSRRGDRGTISFRSLKRRAFILHKNPPCLQIQAGNVLKWDDVSYVDVKVKWSGNTTGPLTPRTASNRQDDCSVLDFWNKVVELSQIAPGFTVAKDDSRELSRRKWSLHTPTKLHWTWRLSLWPLFCREKLFTRTLHMKKLTTSHSVTFQTESGAFRYTIKLHKTTQFDLKAF